MAFHSGAKLFEPLGRELPTLVPGTAGDEKRATCGCLDKEGATVDASPALVTYPRALCHTISQGKGLATVPWIRFTDWHWQVRARLGHHDPPSYIQLMIREVLGVDLGANASDALALITLTAVAVISLRLNLRDWRARPHRSH
jgi:hypothetical protein